MDVIIADDDRGITRTLSLHLSEQTHRVRTAATLAEARRLVAEQEPDVLILDLRLPDGSGLALLEELADRRPQCQVIMITGHQDTTATIRAIQLGAVDYIRKPIDIDAIDLCLEKIKARQQAKERAPTGVAPPEEIGRLEIVGSSRAITEVLKQIALVSQSRVNVLVTGETGTGKELVARRIHQATSPEQPFMAINCSAVVPSLFESELFGHERGSFTGAHERKIGKLELADPGTLFLDEVGDMPMDLQAKLLRVIDQREFERVGGTQAIAFGARIIAATHRDLQQRVAEERFREDLFYRLNVTHNDVPPLRERREDIPEITTHLLRHIAAELHGSVKRVSDATLKRLMAHDWPGNVRELENLLTRAVALDPSDVIEIERIESVAPSREPAASDEGGPLSLHDMERNHIEHVMRLTGGNQTRACEVLGITPPTLRKKLRDYGLKASF